MREDKRELSPAEWNVMESLWAGAPKIGSRVVEDLKESVGWSRSTTLTMLRRMTDKGMIACKEIRGVKAYFPLMDRGAAVRKESENFLNRVYQGDLVLLIRSYVEMQKLSKEDLSALYDILKKAE